MQLSDNWVSEKDLWVKTAKLHRELINKWRITSKWNMTADQISAAVAWIIKLRKDPESIRRRICLDQEHPFLDPKVLLNNPEDWDPKPLNFNQK